MIPVNQPLLDGNELLYVEKCIKTGWISSEGPFVKEFEEKFSSKMGRSHGVAVSNGSVALDLAVLSLGLDRGGEVILPSFTIISCAAAIVRADLVPVAVDCDLLSWNMDSALVEAAITPKTKAIMVVHIYGLPVDMNPILELAKKYKLKIIEDAAESHGQMYFGKPCGSFGDVSTFSFYPNKHITTGEGGMVVCDDPKIADRCRSLRNLCFVPEQRFVHEELGFNFRMTNLQAALGLAQLERLDHFIKIKRQMGAIYTRLLEDIPLIQLPLAKTSFADNDYWVYAVVLDDDVPFDARQAMRLLAEKGIGTRPFFWPMHEQPVLKRMGFFSNVSCPVAERIARRGFYLPSGLALTTKEIIASANALKEILI